MTPDPQREGSEIDNGRSEAVRLMRKRGHTWGNRAEREVRNGKGKREGEGIGDLQGTEEGWMDWGRKSGDE